MAHFVLLLGAHGGRTRAEASISVSSTGIKHLMNTFSCIASFALGLLCHTGMGRCLGESSLLFSCFHLLNGG